MLKTFSIALSINKENIIKKILASEEFKSGSKYSLLLKYIYEANIKGDDVTENSIASDVFNKRIDKDRDYNIRVYIHNLRKKIETYYYKEGKNDKYRISIPKGKYNLEFKKNTDQDAKSFIRPGLTYLIVAVLISTILLVFYKYEVKEKHFRYSSFWSNLLKSDREVIIIAGDYYIIKDTLEDGRAALLRDFNINSDDDFDYYFNENPQMYNKASKTPHSFMTKMIPVGLGYITPILSKNNISYEVELSSSFKWEDAKNKNIIYLGSFKTLYVLETLLKKTNFNYSLNRDIVQYRNSEVDSTISYKTSRLINKGEMIDYAIVAKMKSLSGAYIYFFSSVHDIGNLGSLSIFTNKEKLRKFESKYKTSNPFESLFEVRGYKKTDFSTKLMYINQFAQD